MTSVAPSTPPGAPAHPYVFVSYSAHDRAVVERLVAALIRAGLTVRWDDELWTGDDWKVELAGLHADAAAVLVVWSRSSAQSEFVLEEAGAARRDGKMIAVTLDGFDSVLAPFDDILTLDLSGWSGDADDLRLGELVPALDRRLRLAQDGPPIEKTADEATEPSSRVAASLLPETIGLLGWAVAVQESRGAPAVEDVDVLLGGLVAARAGAATPSVRTLYQGVAGDDGLDAALGAVGAARGNLKASEHIDLTTPALDRAVAAARTTGTFPAVWSRHLLAGALTGDRLPPAVLTALRTDDAGLRRILRRYVAERWPGEPADAWDAILADPEVELTATFTRDLVPVWRRPRAGETRTALTDHLGVDVYVGMLATLVVRRSTAMPLSIGLFGEWGSGKSYFMELLHQQVEALSATATDDGPYCADVVQVRFNAWHYADTNLWASLAAEFFDQLTQEDTDPVEERRKEIAAQLTHAEREQEALEESATAARDRAVALRTSLAEASDQDVQPTAPPGRPRRRDDQERHRGARQPPRHRRR